MGWLRDHGLLDDTLVGKPDRELKRSETQGVNKAPIFTHMLDFIGQTARALSAEPIYEEWSEPGDLLSLEAVHALPIPSNMVEFLPGAPWLGTEVFGADDPAHEPFLRWREGIRTVASALEQALGNEVYYFADLNCEIDDDYVQRFLVLHWCCTYKPECAYVRYLIKVSEARDVEALKAVLVDAENHTPWFDLQGAGLDPDARMSRYEYLRPMVT